MIFETHAHYDDESFDSDREELICSMPERGIGRIINVGASIETTKTTLELAAKYDFVYAAVGVHPSDISGLNEGTFAWLKEQTALSKTVAVGEIGLDYYWDKEPEVQKAQRYWFRRQLELAREAQLPVIIHSRDAAADTIETMKSVHAEEIPGVIHCYSYSKEMAQEFIKMGYYIGVGGMRGGCLQKCGNYSRGFNSGVSSQKRFGIFCACSSGFVRASMAILSKKVSQSFRNFSSFTEYRWRRSALRSEASTIAYGILARCTAAS